jgi:hypothetical protein
LNGKNDRQVSISQRDETLGEPSAREEVSYDTHWILRLSTAMSTRLLSLIVGLAVLIATILAIAAIFGLGGL